MGQAFFAINLNNGVLSSVYLRVSIEVFSDNISVVLLIVGIANARENS